MPGEHDHLHLGSDALDLSQGLLAGHLGHLSVQYDHVWAIPPEDAYPFLGIAHLRHVEASAFEPRSQARSKAVFVVDEQHAQSALFADGSVAAPFG